MKSFMQSINQMIDPLRGLSQCVLNPVMDLTIRLFMAHVFFTSGWLKFQNYLNGDWSSTVFLFEFEHPVPGLSPEVAAIMGTGGELILPVLLALGLFGRFAAAGLLVMTAIIEFTYIHNIQHVMWAMLLGTILLRGPGPISLDRFLMKWLKK